jgi:hypothetical protein
MKNEKMNFFLMQYLKNVRTLQTSSGPLSAAKLSNFGL